MNDHYKTGLAKIRKLEAMTAEILNICIMQAQNDPADVDSREKAREILTNDAGFSIEEFSMFAIFDEVTQ